MRKFMIGCGVLVALVLLIGLVSSWLLVRSLKHQLPVDSLEKQRKELVQLYGGIDDYVPPLDGRLRAERLESYLRVRENLPDDGTAFLHALEHLADQERRLDEAKGLEKLKIGLKMAKGGMGVARVAASFLAARDSLLLVEEMGPGEYLFLTTVTAICDLQWNPPRCRQAQPDSLEMVKLSEARSELRKGFIHQLENARRALRALDELDVAQQEWLAALDDALDHGPIGDDRIPFEDGLPQAMRASIEPWRARIEATLPTCQEAWFLELMVLTDRNEHGFQFQYGGRKKTQPVIEVQ